MACCDARPAVADVAHLSERHRVTRRFAPLLFAAWLALVGVNVARAQPKPDPPPTPLSKRIDRAKQRTHACQHTLGLKPTPSSGRPIYGHRYARWVLTLWSTRAQAYCSMAREFGHPVAAIRAVWGPEHADAALTVSSCETGGTFHVGAQNGQYLGMFQMGSYARSRYGHGDTPLEQARAAHAYWLDAGWSPWQCSPNGGLSW